MQLCVVALCELVQDQCDLQRVQVVGTHVHRSFFVKSFLLLCGQKVHPTFQVPKRALVTLLHVTQPCASCLRIFHRALCRGNVLANYRCY